jgi:hypothetical protein
MMPILYSYFPAPVGRAGEHEIGAVVEGTNYSSRFHHYCPWPEEMPNHREGRNST